LLKLTTETEIVFDSVTVKYQNNYMNFISLIFLNRSF